MMMNPIDLRSVAGMSLPAVAVGTGLGLSEMGGLHAAEARVILRHTFEHLPTRRYLVNCWLIRSG